MDVAHIISMHCDSYKCEFMKVFVWFPPMKGK